MSLTWVVMPRLHDSGPFQGSYGQPRETTQHLLGPIWATFRPTKFKTHYVAPQFYFFGRPSKLRQNFLHWNARIFLFWLNPTGHSKFHNTSNHPLPATNSNGTAHTPLYPPVQVVPPLLPPTIFFSCPGQRNQWRPVLVPMTGVCYNSLLWMCPLNTLTWPDLSINQ